MQVNLHNDKGNQFTSYSATSVTINQTEYNNNLLISPTLIQPIKLQTISELDDQFLAEILTLQPDLIIFGTGTSIQFPNNKILNELQKKRIGFEVMPIPALCRTFNYLIGEGRMVIGILIF